MYRGPKFCNLLVLFLSIVVFTGVFFTQLFALRAAEIKLTGNKNGIKLETSADSFNLEGLFPSKEFREEFSSRVVIKNKSDQNAIISFLLENASGKGNILFEAVELRVEKEGAVLGEGSLAGFAQLQSLGTISSGDGIELDFYFRLPLESGNEYQCQSMDFKLIFSTSQILQYLVAAIANPVAGGTVSGSGIFEPGETVNLIAKANSGYKFLGWWEAGEKVFTGFDYTFVIDRDRSLEARFQRSVIDDDPWEEDPIKDDDLGKEEDNGNDVDLDQGESEEDPVILEETDEEKPEAEGKKDLEGEQPEMPKTGQTSPLIFIGLGLGMVVVGWRLKGK